MGLCNSRQDVHVHNHVVHVEPASPEAIRPRSRSRSLNSSGTSGELHKPKTSSRRNSSPSDTSQSLSKILLHPRTSSISPMNSGSSRSMDSLSPRPKTAGPRLRRNTVSPMESSGSPPQKSFISPRQKGTNTSIFVSQTHSPEVSVPVQSAQLNISSPHPKDTSSSQSSSSPRREFNSSSSISVSPQPRNTSSPKSKNNLSSGDSSFGFVSPEARESDKFKHRSSSKKRSRSGSRRDSAVSSVYLDDGLAANVDSVEIACRKVIEKIESNDDEMREYVKSLLIKWKKNELLEEIMCHALSTSKAMSRQLPGLASYLTRKDTKYFMRIDDSLPGHYSLAKAFAIYFWICQNILFDNKLWKEYVSNPNKEEFNIHGSDVLMAGRSFSLGYSVLFREMATHAGVETVVIEGTLSQVPNPALPGNMTRSSAAVRHTWNAVKLDKTWFQIDCTLGSNYWDKSMEFKNGYAYEYFAPNPSQLILTHYPAEKMWQLLKAPVTSTELEPLVIHPLFAACRHVHPTTWRRTINVDDEKHSAKVTLTVNPSVRIGHRLVYMEDDDEKVKAVQTKSNLVLLQRDGDMTVINVAVPFRGSYSLLLSVNRETKRTVQQLFLSYRIISSSDAKQEIGYPKSYEMAAFAFNFQLLYWNQNICQSICESEAEQLELAFKAKRGIHCSHFLMPGKTRNTIPFDNSMVYKYNTMIVSSTDMAKKGDKISRNEYALKVLFPYEGWWTVCLNATKKNPYHQTTQKQGYVTLMSYHVLARKGNAELSYPFFFSPQVSLSQFNPIPEVSKSIEIPFKTVHPMRFHAFIEERKPIASEFESFVQIEKLEELPEYPHQYKLKACFPKPGKWYVQVYGRQEEKDEKEKVKTANHYLFSVQVNVIEPMEGAVAVTFDSYVTKKEIQLEIDNKGYISFPDDGKPLTVNFKCKKNTPFKHQIQPIEPNNKSKLNEFEGLQILNHCTLINLYKITFAQSMKSRPKLRPGPARASTQPLLPSQLCVITAPYQLHASFPWPGKWIVEVFAKTSSCFDFVPAFNFIVDVKMATKRIYYPILHSEIDQFGLTIPEENISYNPIYDSSQFQYALNAPPNTSIAWNIKVDDSEISYATQGYVQESIAKNANHLFRLSFSTPGVWKVHLFAAKDSPNGKKVTEDDFSPVIDLSFLVKHFDPDVAFPEIYPNFKKYKLSINPADVPFISRVHNTASKVLISLISPGNVDFAHQMESAEMNVDECRPLCEMYSDESGSGLHEVALRIIRPGLFSVMIWARFMDSENQEWEPVLRHTIECIAQD